MGDRRGGRTRALLATAAVALLLAACGAAGGTAGNGETAQVNPRQPVQELLRERSDAFNAGNLDAYLAPLGPEARAFEEPIVRRALELPLERVDLVLAEAEISDDGARFRRATIEFVHSFSALPADNPFRLRLQADIERRPEGWVITTLRFHPDAPPPLWATGPVTVSPSEHFVVLARPDAPRVAAAIAEAERARAALVPQLTLEADPKHLLVLAANRDEFKALTGSEAIALSWVEYRQVSPRSAYTRPVNRHTVVDLSQVFGREGRPVHEDDPTAVTPTQVFQHELAHEVLSRFTRACTDRWVAEGAAMLLSGERRLPQWKQMVAEPGALEKVSLRDAPVHYAYVNASVLHLAETFGRERFFDFYQNFKNLPETGCTGETGNVRSRLSERLLRRHYRLGVDELDEATREYVRNAVAP